MNIFFFIENITVNRYNNSGDIMKLIDKISKLKLSIYKLSKLSGVPHSTLADIVSGKSNIYDCSGKTLKSISKVLNITIEELLDLQQPEYKPEFERNLPDFLTECLKKLKTCKNDLYDCYWCEVNSSINVCEVENLISKEHANYLRNKYLW